jgi:hypothetical protein
MKNCFLIISLFFISFSYSQDDSLSYEEKKRSGDYYPYIKLTEFDSLEWPSEYNISLIINDLRDVSIKQDYFSTIFYSTEYTSQDTIYFSQAGGEISINPSEEYLLEYPEGDMLYSEFVLNRLDKVNNDSVYVYSRYFEGELPHKWNLKDFPFDIQELKIQFRSRYDTSVTRVFASDDYEKTKIIQEDIVFLRDGYSIKEIVSENQFVTGPEDRFADSYRQGVYDKLIFKIVLERNSSYLYFKLFFGAFLSYIISLLVFFIDKKLFETRITLSLGGIFGAVGNKYFVENSLPELLVLTKADLINNFIIVFIIVNIFLVIGQATKNINLGLFEKNKSALILSIVAFIITNIIIITY